MPSALRRNRLLRSHRMPSQQLFNQKIIVRQSAQTPYCFTKHVSTPLSTSNPLLNFFYLLLNSFRVNLMCIANALEDDETEAKSGTMNCCEMSDLKQLALNNGDRCVRASLYLAIAVVAAVCCACCCCFAAIAASTSAIWCCLHPPTVALTASTRL